VATYTSHLGQVSGDREIVVLHPPDQPRTYPLEVHHRIGRDEPADYPRTARGLGACADLVSIQYDSAIWGGGGTSVLDFIRALDLPAVATLHHILPRPTAAQRSIVAELVDNVQATVVLSRAAAALLASAYGIEPSRVRVIGPGIPHLPIADAESMKPGLGMADREVILGFGLLRPDKGYELVLAALPAVIAKHPSATFVIVGATHPDELHARGEAYRTSLVGLTEQLGLEAHIQFVDRFVERMELLRWLEAADVVVTPNLDPDKTDSAVLAYAMGAGRAIVASPFAHAVELLADDRGVLLPNGKGSARRRPAALAEAINRLLDDPDRRAELGRRAHEGSRWMVWSEVGTAYRRLFDQVIGKPDRRASSAELASASASAGA
jgi:glycosyltransferase involved in cell wall biosynthesis